MSGPIYLSWDNFQSTILVRGQQRVHRITSAPLIELFGDGTRHRIGIWAEVDASTVIPPELVGLELIRARTVVRDERTLLEVTTESGSLQRQFYHFAVAVAERILVEGLSAIDAVAIELRCFSDLLEEKSGLSIEKQIGLIGELLFLDRLTRRRGAEALDAWLGPSGEPHDFRLGKREFEVKTTLSTKRIHTIHGAHQLVPSKDCTLALISVVLGPAGADDGFSVSEKISQLEAVYAVHVSRLTQFSTAVAASGYRPEDRLRYTRRFSLRRPIAVIMVDSGFPAITWRTVQAQLGPLAPRIEGLQYDVNVEGLEQEDGTETFETVISP